MRVLDTSSGPGFNLSTVRVRGFVKFVPAVARLVCPDLLGVLLDYVLQTIIPDPVQFLIDYAKECLLIGFERSFQRLQNLSNFFSTIPNH